MELPGVPEGFEVGVGVLAMALGVVEGAATGMPPLLVTPD